MAQQQQQNHRLQQFAGLTWIPEIPEQEAIPASPHLRPAATPESPKQREWKAGGGVRRPALLLPYTDTA